MTSYPSVFLTPDETAEMLRTSRKAVYSLIERRRLPGVARIGRRLLVRRESLLSWLDQQGADSLLGDER